MKENLYHYKAQVNRVIDGNTFVADIDLGMGIWRHDVHVDLHESIAPADSSSALGELIDSKEVILRIYRIDGFGRAVADVCVDGKSLTVLLKDQLT